jgi:aspartate kinase
MLEMSAAGSGVLQMRAVEFARKFNVVIHSRSAFFRRAGDIREGEFTMMEEAVITGMRWTRQK